MLRNPVVILLVVVIVLLLFLAFGGHASLG